MRFIEFLATQIVGDAGVLFGLIALLGLILLRRRTEEVIVGTVKTIIGYVILVAGAQLLLTACESLTGWVRTTLGVQGVIPQNWLIVAEAMKSNAREVGLVVITGFIINLLLARLTPIKSVAVTGHIMMIWACWLIGILMVTPWSTSTRVIVGSVLAGLHYWLTPALTGYFLKRNDRLTKEWGLYIPEITGIAVAAWLGRMVGNAEQKCDDIKLPKRLEWLRDTTVGVAVVAALFWSIFGILAGPEVVQKSAGTQNWVLYLIMLGVKFSGGLAVVLYGVRMLLAEIVPAFNGIASKLIPGAIPGLDYPTIFHFAPAAVFLGFIFNLLGGIAATLVMVALGMDPIVLPAVWMNFWSGAAIGVVADAYGGRRGTIIVNLLLGFLVPFGWHLAYPMSGLFSQSGIVNDYTDVSTYSLLLQYLLRLF